MEQDVVHQVCDEVATGRLACELSDLWVRHQHRVQQLQQTKQNVVSGCRGVRLAVAKNAAPSTNGPQRKTNSSGSHKRCE
jgi:hypothetical protein